MQQWLGLSDPAMEDGLHDVPLYWEFAGLDAGVTRMPDESTILRFRHLLEANYQSPVAGRHQRHTGHQRPSAQEQHRDRREPHYYVVLDQEPDG